MAHSASPASERDSFFRLQEKVENRVLEITTALSTAEVDNKQVFDDLLTQLREVAHATPQMRFGFFGQRGCGKTTLLNRILGVQLLPTGPVSATTATLTEIIGWPDKDNYTATVYFITIQDFIDLVRASKKELNEARNSKDSLLLTSAELGPDTTELHEMLLAMYGSRNNPLVRGSLAEGFEWEKCENEETLLPNDVLTEMRGHTTTLKTNSPTEMARRLLQYTHRSKKLWPVVFKITVRGCFQRLNEGAFSLVDIPGSNDGDVVMARRHQLGKSMCDQVYYLPHPYTLLSNLTADNCTSLETLESNRFAIIVSHSQRYVKHLQEPQDDDPPLDLHEMSHDILVKRFRDDMRAYFRDPSKSDRFMSIPVYFMESEDWSSSVPKVASADSFDQFVAIELMTVRPETSKLRERYVSDFNIILMALQSSLPISVEAHRRVRKLFESMAKDDTYRNYKMDMTVISQWIFDNVKVPQSLELIAPSINWNTLRSILAYEGEFKTHSLSKSILQGVADVSKFPILRHSVQLLANHAMDLGIDRLESIVQDFPLEVNDLKTSMLNNLKNLRGGTQLRVFVFDVQYFVADEIRAYLKQLPNLVASGNNCKKRMLAALQNWWQSSNADIVAKVGSAIQKGCESYFKRELQMITDRVESWRNVVKASPEVSKALKNLDLFDLLTPISNFNEPYVSVSEHENVVPDDSMDVDNEKTTQFRREYAHIQAKYSELLEKLPSDYFFSPRGVSSGYIYVFSNQSYGHIYKVGQTKGPPSERAKQLFTTGVPSKFDVVHFWDVSNVSGFEKLLHMLLRRVRTHQLREFFDCPLDLIKEVGDLMYKHRVAHQIGHVTF